MSTRVFFSRAFSVRSYASVGATTVWRIHRRDNGKFFRKARIYESHPNGSTFTPTDQFIQTPLEGLSGPTEAAQLILVAWGIR